jgi:hypothetical protein
MDGMLDTGLTFSEEIEARAQWLGGERSVVDLRVAVAHDERRG